MTKVRPVAAPREDRAHELQQDGVHRGNRRQRRRVDERALDDHLDVHQPIADDGRGERERHDAEQHRRDVRAAVRRESQRERQRVSKHERHRAERGPPDDPSELTPCGHRSRASERPDHDPQTDDEPHTQADHFAALDERDHVREHDPLRVAAHERGHSRGEEQKGRQVQERKGGAAGFGMRPAVGTFGEHQREMDDERRQQQRAHHVRPVDDPVERVEAAAERKRQHAEEGNGQPEEVERRLIVRTAEADAGADEQRKNADRGEDVIQAAGAGRDRRKRNAQALLRSGPNQRVGDRIAGGRPMQACHDVRLRIDGCAINFRQDVAGKHAGPGRW